jgi:hypothetical protein
MNLGNCAIANHYPESGAVDPFEENLVIIEGRDEREQESPTLDTLIRHLCEFSTLTLGNTVQDYYTDQIGRILGNEIPRIALHQYFQTGINEIRSYLDLEKGWDGYRGATFSKDFICTTEKILLQSAGYFYSLGLEPDEVTPCPASDGSVEIEIHYQNKELFLSLSPNSREMGIYLNDGMLSKEYRDILEEKTIQKQLQWLVG